MKQFRRIAKELLICSAAIILVASCSKDDKPYTEEEELSKTELKTILETDDVSSVADDALSQLYMDKDNSAKSGKVEECYTAEYTETGFTATFENCNLNGTDNVNGTLSVVYETSQGSAAFTATYSDFYVGSIKINGTRSYVLTSNEEEGSVALTVTSNMTVTMEDESVVAESGTKTLGFDWGDSFETSIFTISGNWTLEADGDTYKVVVGSTLTGNLGCAYLNKGTMTVDKNGLIVGVDFGDGTCDDVAMLSYPNGATEEISLKD